MKSGTKILELNRDVHNPQPDRRSVLWHKQELIRKGRRFKYTEKNGTELATLESGDRRGYGITILPHDPLWHTLWPHLIEVEPTVEEQLNSYGTRAVEVLRLLLRDGSITMDTVKAAARVVSEMDEDQYNKLMNGKVDTGDSSRLY
jgi:hypothetical protein